MVGRITEEHLDTAEKTFPGILAMYRSMRVKPRTFLELLWTYEQKASAMLFPKVDTPTLQAAS